MRKLFTIFAALTLSVGLWAQGSVFTYTATQKLEVPFKKLGTVATHEFNEQTGAGTVTYSSTVTKIGESGFASNRSLQSITIPASVTTIEKNAFEVCYSLTSVTFKGNACNIGKNAFYYVGTATNPATLVLPADWTGEKPVDSQTAWYGGYFKLETPAPATVKVAYLDPVYNDPTDVTKGIKEWKNATADAIEITDSSDTLAAGWYVVNGTDVQTSTLVCEGEVHLILADGAKLTATGADYAAGIQVFDEGNSLTIYGQTNQTGELIANGGAGGAGIGGGSGNDGSNITINGGTVTATGSERIIPPSSPLRMVTANGGNSSAGIGGGVSGDGSNITINGGIVTAISGKNNVAGIGGGDFGSGSDIFVATSLVVKADNNNPPTTVIANDGSDLASSLAGKQYATVENGSDPSALPTLFGDGVKGNKFMHKGQLIIRSGNKTYNALGF